MYAIGVSVVVPVVLVLSFLIVAFERSDGYVEAAAVTVGTVLGVVYVNVLPGLGVNRLVERQFGQSSGSSRNHYRAAAQVVLHRRRRSR
jgi:hypothetical protein